MKSIEILKEKKVPYRLIKLSKKGISFEDVINYAEDKLNPDEICKTIIVKDKKNNKYGFLLKGNQKIDFAKAKKIIGNKISIISYEDLIETTGNEPGAICPFLLDIPLFVDKKVFENQKINFGSGNHLFGIEIDSKDLKRLTDFEIVEVTS